MWVCFLHFTNDIPKQIFPIGQPILLGLEVKMSNCFEENRALSDQAEDARETARLAACRALDLARKCKKSEGEIDPQVKAQASQLGKEAWEYRKKAREIAAQAASARRVACFKAMPATPVPEIPRSALPLKPPKRHSSEEE
jgi:hypothetical protein